MVLGYKKLISPEIRVTIGDYEIKNGVEVECVSSNEPHSDWCKVELSPNLQGVVEYNDMDEVMIELGYEEDYDCLIAGYARKNDGDYWKEVMVKDDMIRLERIKVKGTFMDCTPQDIIRYILIRAGITDYILTDKSFGKKKVYSIDEKSGVAAIAEIDSSWGIRNLFFFQDKVFYYGTKKEQSDIYTLEEDETIISLHKYGDMWEAEVIAIPWIHHSQEIEVKHSKYSGTVEVVKTIIRSDSDGSVHMYIYWR